MIDLNIKEIIFFIKIIDLNGEISTKKVIMVLVFEIDGGSIHIVMALINQDITMLFQIVMLISKI